MNKLKTFLQCGRCLQTNEKKITRLLRYHISCLRRTVQRIGVARGGAWGPIPPPQVGKITQPF